MSSTRTSLHDWNLTPTQAAELQRTLRERVVADDCLGEVKRVAGVDASYRKAPSRVRSAIVVLAYPGLELVDHAKAERPAAFPYIPGLLSFRELPAILAALERLSAPPDLILCDGHGYAHPRRFGLACHLGVLSGIPTIGVAKRILVGRHDPVPDVRGAWRPLLDGEETIGAALRAREGVRPIYVSIGHRISLETAIAWVMRCLTRYRLPEPTRAAHRLAGKD